MRAFVEKLNVMHGITALTEQSSILRNKAYYHKKEEEIALLKITLGSLSEVEGAMCTKIQMLARAYDRTAEQHYDSYLSSAQRKAIIGRLNEYYRSVKLALYPAESVDLEEAFVALESVEVVFQALRADLSELIRDASQLIQIAGIRHFEEEQQAVAPAIKRQRKFIFLDWDLVESTKKAFGILEKLSDSEASDEALDQESGQAENASAKGDLEQITNRLKTSLEACASRYGGLKVKAEGDRHVYVFESTNEQCSSESQALKCAIEILSLVRAANKIQTLSKEEFLLPIRIVLQEIDDEFDQHIDFRESTQENVVKVMSTPDMPPINELSNMIAVSSPIYETAVRQRWREGHTAKRPVKVKAKNGMETVFYLITDIEHGTIKHHQASDPHYFKVDLPQECLDD